MAPSKTTSESVPKELIINEATPNIPYFAPKQEPLSGTILDATEDETPILFKPIKLRGLTLHNRILLSPLCQYSSEDGHPTPGWHMAHLGGILQSGPGLTIAEATAVQARGRITPEDAGLWKDSHIEAWKPIVTMAHSLGQKIGIQLAHAGRKASMVAPWLSFSNIAWEEAGGWPEDVIAPSAVKYSDTYPNPREMTIEEIEEFKSDWAAAVKRAVAAGFDAIEIHNAHGYLLQEFLSPLSNKRTDKYGGSFENRIRLTLEIVDICRANMPEDMPLLLRISGSDCVEHLDIPSWKSEDTVRLAPILQEHGVDLYDISAGGNDPRQNIPFSGAQGAYQAHFAEAVKKALGPNAKMLVGSVGGIRSGPIAEEVLKKGQADVVLVGRWFQKNPRIPQTFGEELGVTVELPKQIRWAFRGRGGGKKKVEKKTEDRPEGKL